MKHDCSENTAAICGLFCGICPAFPEMCDGCLSDRVLPFCAECGAGFRKCAREHAVKRCSECPDSPCERLIRFNADEYEHHHIVLENNARMKEISVSAWIDEQVRDHTCSECSEIIKWERDTCQKCGHKAARRI